MNDGMTRAKNYKIKSHNKAVLFDRRAFQLSIISKSNILLQICRSIYTLTLWDTNDQFCSQRADCKFAERKWTEDKTTLRTFCSFVSNYTVFLGVQVEFLRPKIAVKKSTSTYTQVTKNIVPGVDYFFLFSHVYNICFEEVRQ